MSTINYIGCFLDKSVVGEYAEQQNSERLHRVIEHPHVTFEYKPKVIPYELFGLIVTVRVIGYGCDGENEAFKVEFENLSKELVPLAQLIEIPHITISVSENGEAVNSRNLNFIPIQPVYLQGVFGGKDCDGFVHTDRFLIENEEWLISMGLFEKVNN